MAVVLQLAVEEVAGVGAGGQAVTAVFKGNRKAASFLMGSLLEDSRRVVGQVVSGHWVGLGPVRHRIEQSFLSLLASLAS